MMRRLTLAAILFCVAVGLATANGLDISPNPDGSFDVRFELDWEYRGNLYSGFTAEYRDIVSDEESADSYVSLTGKDLSLAIDVLGYRIRRNEAQMEVGFNGQWNRTTVREIGYIDSSGTRYFILNDRVISMLLPRLLGVVRIPVGPARLSVGGEFAPWLWVQLNQTLTISPGLDATPFESEQAAYMAFSVNAALRNPGNMITTEVAAEYDHVPIEYDVYTAGGPATINVLMQNLSVSATAIISAIELDGLSPAVTVGYRWDWTTDLAAGTPVTVVPSFDFSFGFDL